jgi:AraC-like DNA-binding protein
MSRAVAAVHGRFGRATIYTLNRPFNIHAHREGHLIFHLSGDDGGVLVSGIPRLADIGYNLGFSSQSGFTRFFAANVGMAPTQYRRVAHVL